MDKMLVRKVATRIEYACSGKLPSTTQMINDRMWLCERAGIDKSEARNSAARILFIEKVIKEELAQAIEELRLLLESFGFSKDQTIAKMNAIVPCEPIVFTGSFVPQYVKDLVARKAFDKQWEEDHAPKEVE